MYAWRFSFSVFFFFFLFGVRIRPERENEGEISFFLKSSPAIASGLLCANPRLYFVTCVGELHILNKAN